MGLLDDVRVLDLSTYVMGPFAAMMLADMGADVIKVEPPRGDPNRRIGRQSGATGVLFASTNHAKRSIVLDLKDPGDAAVAPASYGGPTSSSKTGGPVWPNVLASTRRPSMPSTPV